MSCSNCKQSNRHRQAGYEPAFCLRIKIINVSILKMKTLLISLSICCLFLSPLAHASMPSKKIAASIEKFPKGSPAERYYSYLLTIVKASHYSDIKQLYSQRMQNDASKLPEDVALQTAKMTAAMLLGTRNEIVEQYENGDSAVVKLSNRKFIKPTSGDKKIVGKNILSVYYQLLKKENGDWRIDVTSEITDPSAPDKSANEMSVELLKK